MNSSDYARVLMPEIPRQAFEPAPRKLWTIAAHLVVIAGGWITLPRVAPVYWPLVSLTIGFSLSCIALIAHDVSHRNVVRSRFLLYPLELLLWSLVCVPTTVWRRAHSYHHIATNAVDDPKRRFLKSEAGVTTATYGALFYPHRGLRYNPLCLLYFATTNIRNLVAAFYVGDSKPRLVPSKPAYTHRDRLKIVFELAVIVAIQIAIWASVGHRAFVSASLFPVFVASAVASLYFFASHAFRPLRNDGDVLEASTSIVLPRIIDKLHVNQSYHTEHHLFPNMNPDYYPLVGQLIERHFLRSYHRIPVSLAWSQMWKLPLFIPPPHEINS
jgi:fatty acid desaturase